MDMLIETLSKYEPSGKFKVIVFMNLKRRCEIIAELLSAKVIHSRISNGEEFVRRFRFSTLERLTNKIYEQILSLHTIFNRVWI